MTSFVLDASAVMAFLGSEAGADAVEPHLHGGRLSAVNYAEVLSKSQDRGLAPDPVASILSQLGIELVAFNEKHAALTADLRGPTRAFGLSLGDRACLALATATGLPVLTADRRWMEIGLPIDIQLIR